MFYHEHPFSRSYGVILPSSLTRVLSLTLVFSTRLPVSVCGTGSVILPRSFSRQCDISDFSTLFRSASQLVLVDKSISLLSKLTACTYISISTLLIASCVPPSVKRITTGTGISTCYPSTTLLSLALGPD